MTWLASQMTELLHRQQDWSPERKRTRLDEVEEMEVDGGTPWLAEDTIMMVDDEFVEMCFRQVERMDVTNNPAVLFNLGRKGSRGCICCKRHFKKYCRKKRMRNLKWRDKTLK